MKQNSHFKSIKKSLKLCQKKTRSLFKEGNINPNLRDK